MRWGGAYRWRQTVEQMVEWMAVMTVEKTVALMADLMTVDRRKMADRRKMGALLKTADLWQMAGQLMMADRLKTAEQ